VCCKQLRGLAASLVAVPGRIARGSAALRLELDERRGQVVRVDAPVNLSDSPTAIAPSHRVPRDKDRLPRNGSWTCSNERLSSALSTTPPKWSTQLHFIPVIRHFLMERPDLDFRVSYVCPREDT